MARRVAKAPPKRERLKLSPPSAPVLGVWAGRTLYSCPHCSVNSLRESVVTEHLRLNHREPEPETSQEEVIPSASAESTEEEKPSIEKKEVKKDGKG